MLIYNFSFCMFRVQKESPIRVFTADMFATPSYVASKFSHHFAEALFPSPTHRPFNKLVLVVLDIEAEHGDDSDRHGCPSC